MDIIRKTFFWRVLRKIKRLPMELQVKLYEKKFNGKPFTPDMQKKIQKIIKRKRNIYFRDEKTARNLADSWHGTINKPQNLRFIENAVPVVLCANEDFAPYTAVMLQSLLDNSNLQRKYHFIIFERDFSDKTKDSLINQAGNFRNCEIDFVNTADAFNEIPIPSPGSHFSIDMYSRLFIPYWLDDYHKIIYCDGDMLAKTDISELYDLDVQDRCMGAVIGPASTNNLDSQAYNFFLNAGPVFMLLENWYKYLNSELLVFNTSKFKEMLSYQDLFKFAIYFTNRYKNHWGDQDILALLVKDDYSVLPSEWNYSWWIGGRFRYSDSSTKIIHFTTNIKPWKDCPDIANHPDALAYRYYARNVPLFDNMGIFLNNIEIHLAEHCNLNCKYCTHFCPVAERDFPDIEQFEQDLIKLGRITKGYIKRIKLLGGEPLLNPEIVRIIHIVRRNIPNSTNIEITTNGVLLMEMQEDFWIACRNNDISIHISPYPINLNRNQIIEIAQKHRVKVLFETIDRSSGIFWWSQKFDMKGNRNIHKAYKRCPTRGCTFLKDGKIYLCAQIPSSQHLEKYFGVKFSITNNDFLVLDDVKDIQEILDFKSRPSSFCRYCATDRIRSTKWGISKKQRREWIL